MEGAIIAVAANVWLGLIVLVPAMKRNQLFNWSAELKAMPVGLLGYFLFSLLLGMVN